MIGIIVIIIIMHKDVIEIKFGVEDDFINIMNEFEGP